MASAKGIETWTHDDVKKLIQTDAHRELKHVLTVWASEWELFGSPQEMLVFASELGSVNCIQVLIEKFGVNPNLRQHKQSQTPLEAACYQNQIHSVYMLCRCGAYINQVNPETGRNVLHFLCGHFIRDPDDDPTRLIEFVISRIRSVNVCDVDGNTALHLCCMSSPYAVFIAKLLRLHGADPMIRNNMGYTTCEVIHHTTPSVFDKLMDVLKSPAAATKLSPKHDFVPITPRTTTVSKQRLVHPPRLELPRQFVGRPLPQRRKRQREERWKRAEQPLRVLPRRRAAQRAIEFWSKEKVIPPN